MALSAGYEQAKGDCVITIDADLQGPPEIIPKMVERWEKGSKVIYARREKRDVDSFFKKMTASLFIDSLIFFPTAPSLRKSAISDSLIKKWLLF